MTVFYSAEAQLLANTPRQFPDGAAVNAKLRRYRNVITLASQTTSDTIQLVDIPPGNLFAFGVLNTDTSLGSSTIAIGISGTAAYFKAAAVLTATNTPTLFGANAAADDDFSTKTGIVTPIVTIAAATMPASGQLIIDMYFSGN